MDDTDEALAARAAAGDRPAFDRLTARYTPRLVGLVRAAHRLPLAVAEEVAQQALLQAWVALPTWKATSFRGWLFAIARHLAADIRRRAATRRTVGDPDGDIIKLAPAAGPPPDAGLAAADDAARLRDCLDRLAAGFRVLVVGYYFDGQDYAQLAAANDLPEGTVKSRLSRGKADLRTCMGEDDR